MELFAIAAVVGIFIGLISGLLGVGGGVIMVPVFRLAFGLPPVASTATSLFAIIPTSISGAITHIRNKTCVVSLGIVLGVGGACTSPLGAWLANISPGWLVMTATAIVVAYSGFTMVRKALKVPRASMAKVASPDARSASKALSPDARAVSKAVSSSTRPASGSPSADVEPASGPARLDAEPASGSPSASPQAGSGQFTFDLTAPNIAKGIGIGLVTGVASGYVGLGGGFIMVPLMISLFGMGMRQTSGTSLIAIMMLALPGTIMQAALSNVDFLVGIATCCGSIPGALVGAKLVPHMPERALRLIFAAFLGVAAILLVVKETGVLG